MGKSHPHFAQRLTLSRRHFLHAGSLLAVSALAGRGRAAAPFKIDPNQDIIAAPKDPV